ncbi:NRDE family protein [Acidocella sp.]|uniref:NRDE family protein n=1 Tax=Acidocella sp. TaxID=50710 RepID=UPI00261A9E20|nr:NRDE family protein [Acidocella sp.]MDD2795340.1 NRDE family protein [Acidocella sp.]
MCSIILRIGAQGVFIGANRDEMVERAWEPPGEFWPGVIAGRDRLAGGTWLGMNRHGVAAAVLNRTGTLGPAAGKRSRGELPLLALRESSAEAAARVLAGLDAGAYRPFNLVVANAAGAFLLRGLGAEKPDVARLGEGVSMITSGEPNDAAHPRIARHLPRFAAAAFEDWAALLADATGPWESALNIPEKDGFATVCSSLIALPCPPGKAQWRFAAGRPDVAAFVALAL